MTQPRRLLIEVDYQIQNTLYRNKVYHYTETGSLIFVNSFAQLNDAVRYITDEAERPLRDLVTNHRKAINLEVIKALINCIGSNQKITCIKTIRTVTDLGLKEAKDLFEALVPPN